jgi:FKBP-type peptidyl-prolyl cis-trans isomerase
MKQVYVWGIAGVILLAGVHYYTTRTSGDVDSKKESVATPNTTHTTMQESMIGGMKVVDEVVGTGDEAKKGTSVTVHYVGTLTNGTVFDASRNHGNDGFTFALGAGQVIKGWDLGVAGMKVGGKRNLVIAPAMGYGARDVGPIPANSTLVFEVELLGVK